MIRMKIFVWFPLYVITYENLPTFFFGLSSLNYVRWSAKKVSHHLNVSVIKALITHLDFDVTEK
jgi:hypothetical protein